MYKVFIKDKVILFSKKHSTCDADFKSVLKLAFFDQSFSKHYVKLLTKDKKLEAIVFAVDDPEASFKMFSSSFETIKAAGGLVKNNEGKMLFIYRLDKWDLPKGKLEKGEEIKDAAIREVEEECAVSGLKITQPLKDTFHIYHLKEGAILKQTHWFAMETDFNGELKPQIEEGIEQVKWFSEKEIKEIALKNTYASIADFLITNGY